jgi:hypothetical protein
MLVVQANRMVALVPQSFGVSAGLRKTHAGFVIACDWVRHVHHLSAKFPGRCRNRPNPRHLRPLVK